MSHFSKILKNFIQKLADTYEYLLENYMIYGEKNKDKFSKKSKSTIRTLKMKITNFRLYKKDRSNYFNKH